MQNQPGVKGSSAHAWSALLARHECCRASLSSASPPLNTSIPLTHSTAPQRNSPRSRHPLTKTARPTLRCANRSWQPLCAPGTPARVAWHACSGARCSTRRPAAGAAACSRRRLQPNTRPLAPPRLQPRPTRPLATSPLAQQPQRRAAAGRTVAAAAAQQHLAAAAGASKGAAAAAGGGAMAGSVERVKDLFRKYGKIALGVHLCVYGSFLTGAPWAPPCRSGRALHDLCSLVFDRSPPACAHPQAATWPSTTMWT